MGQCHVVLDPQLLRAQGITSFGKGSCGILHTLGVFLHLPGEALGQSHHGAPGALPIGHEGGVFDRRAAEPGGEVA